MRPVRYARALRVWTWDALHDLLGDEFGIGGQLPTQVVLGREVRMLMLGERDRNRTQRGMLAAEECGGTFSVDVRVAQDAVIPGPVPKIVRMIPAQLACRHEGVACPGGIFEVVMKLRPRLDRR